MSAARPANSMSASVNRLLACTGWQMIGTVELDRLQAAVSHQDAIGASFVPPVVPPGWEDPLAVLRRKWGEIPAGDRRLSSAELLRRSDSELLAEWERARRNDTEGMGFGVRGWYHEVYRTLMAESTVLDVGCGMALSTLSFAEMGARVTFVDIIPENVELVRRLCRAKGIYAQFGVLETFKDFDRLADNFDVITAIGSLINAPLAVTRLEVERLKAHLRPGGRWLHLAYPKARWVQEGMIDFAAWGEHTDGAGTPWMEYHDIEKIRWLFSPSEIRVVFECEWHEHHYNWFDIELIRH